MYNAHGLESDLVFHDPHSHSHTEQSRGRVVAFPRSNPSLRSFESASHLDVPTSPNSTYSFDLDLDTSLPATSRPSSPCETVSSLTQSISSVPTRTFIDRTYKPKGARKPRKRRVPNTQRPLRSPSLVSTYTAYDVDPLAPFQSTMHSTQTRARKLDQRHMKTQPSRTAPPVSRSAFMSSSNTSVSTVRTYSTRVVDQPRSLRHPYSSSYAPSPGPSTLDFPSRETPREFAGAGYTWLSELNYYDSDVSMGQFASRIKAHSSLKPLSSPKSSTISGTSTARVPIPPIPRSQESHTHVRPLPPIPGSKPASNPKKKRHVPPPLRLAESACRTEESTPAPDNVVTLLPSALLSPNISTAALTPISPSLKKPSEHEQRRRKLMKVGKIFGEKVPVDLVLPPRQSAEEIPPVPPLPPFATNAGSRVSDYSEDEGNRRSSLTLPNLGLSSLTAAIRAKKPELTVRPKVVRKKRSYKQHNDGIRRRSSNHDIKTTRSSSQPSFQLVIQDEDSKKLSDDDSPLVQSLPYKSRLEPAYFPVLANRADAPFWHAQLPGSPGLQGDGRHGVLRKERRQGWSGEWNQEDINDVITKLRQLK